MLTQSGYAGELQRRAIESRARRGREWWKVQEDETPVRDAGDEGRDPRMDAVFHDITLDQIGDMMWIVAGAGPQIG